MKRKQIHRRFTALVLALSLGAGLALPAGASEALGHDLHTRQTQLAQGTSLTRQIFWSDTWSDLREEQYFTYTPNQAVVPVVAYGEKLLDRATLTEMAAGLESQGRTLAGGVNGDLYVLSTGAPLGLVISGGVLRSAPGSKDFGYYGVGFREDGTAFIGKPEISLEVTLGGERFAIGGGLNKVRERTAGYVLYTEDFAATTQHTAAGIDVILAPVEEDLGEQVSSGEGTLVLCSAPTLGGRVVCRVEQVLGSDGEIPIPEGKLILSINGGGDPYLVSRLKDLQEGDEVTIDVTASQEIWYQAAEAMGGYRKLVTAGAVETDLPAEQSPYTAIGVRADGTAIFYTIDGRQPGHSVGATLTQVAERLVELGCVDAVSLDGGGSTTLGATLPGEDSLSVQNRPSDGKERANSVCLFLENRAERTDRPGSWYVKAENDLVLAGAKVEMEATLLDTAYYPMEGTARITWGVDGNGRVDESGAFTAGRETGVVTVTATGRGVTGGTTVTVIGQPDQIRLTEEKSGAIIPGLNLSPNETRDLTATALWRTMELFSQDTCFTWSMDSQVAWVDQTGRITAGGNSGSGNLTVSIGEKSVSIPVAVTGHVLALDGFEEGIDHLTVRGGGALSWEGEDVHVRYGGHSLRLDYEFSEEGAFVTGNWPVVPGESWLNLWVYGDGSGNTLSGFFEDGAGGVRIEALAELDFSGWRYVQWPLPVGTAAVQMLSLTCSGEVRTGRIWLDQLTTSNEPIADTVSPALTLSVEDGVLQGTVLDNIDRSIPRENISLTWDGTAMDFLWSQETGLLRAALPVGDGRLHHVAVTVSDASGNLRRAGVDLEPDGEREAVFSDTGGHWSEKYGVYLYDHGVTTGVPDDVGGTLLFQPEKSITRGEFFTMLGRWLGVDLSLYRETVLPFADAGEIPAWAEESVKAMYALGYLKGSAQNGVLTANITAPISRAEAMTLVGRIQPRGHVGETLSFLDVDEIPDWALSHVEVLVEQKAVSGYGERLMPLEAMTRGEVAKMLFALT